MIDVQRITKTFEGQDQPAVDAVSFRVSEGEIFGLIGTSGCGKTTTLKMINRLVEPTSGQIFLHGKSIREQPVEQLRRNIGYVIQSVGLFPHYSIEQNVSIVPHLLHWNASRIEQRTAEMLGLVGLDPEKFGQRKPQALSGGQQQRVGLARALAGNPDLLLMDEPFGALDPITKDKVRDEFKTLLSNIDKTVILVTHDVFEAFDLCDSICLMDQGRTQQVGTPKDLLFRPANEFVSSFFDSHRFQLEMAGITIGDILQSMPGILQERGYRETPGTKADSSDSILSVLKQKQDHNSIAVSGAEGEVSGIIDKGDLFQSFLKLCTELRGGSHG